MISMTTSNKEFNFYPRFDRPKDSNKGYIDIRISDKRTKGSRDIAVYLESGERLIVDQTQFKDQKVVQYRFPDQLQEVNDRMEDVLIKVKKFINVHPTATKGVVEEHIYGKPFLIAHKKKRTFKDTLAVYEVKPSELAERIKSKFPVQEIPYIISNVDEDGFETNLTQINTIDPLSFDNFPNEFDPAIYKKFKNDLLVESPFLSDLDTKMFNEFLKYFIKDKLKTVSIKEVITIDSKLKKEMDNNKITDWDSYEVEAIEARIRVDRKRIEGQQADEQKRRKLLPPLERYKNGEYDKSNIFEVLGQILFLNKSRTKKYSGNWKMAVMKMFDYRSRFEPKDHVKDLSDKWVDDFITTIMTNGFSKAHPKHFNPFNYDSNIFVKSEIGFYNDLSLEKFIKNTKEIFRHFSTEELLPMVNVDKIKYENYHLSNVYQETEKDFYLTKPELDKLFFHKFKDSELSRIRHLFLLQFWFGGLRPKEELLNEGAVSVLPDGDGGKKVVYIISKDTGLTNENPITTYSDLILKLEKPVLLTTTIRRKRPIDSGGN
jgi:hypothetical protein